MDLSSDYFLLYHGVNFKTSEEEQVIFSPENEESVFKLFALVLQITRKEFEKFHTLDAFAVLCKELGVELPKNLQHLHLLQYRIIDMLSSPSQPQVFQLFQDTFLTLLEEKVLKKENYKKLISLFEVPEVKTEMTASSQKVFSFQEEKEKLFVSMQKISAVIDEQDIFKEIQTFLTEQKFSVGITGVMNAGKSTMINALMGKEILGTSVVPETANLTVLKYDEKIQAKVFYWNKKEWHNIVSTASKMDAMQAFVSETEKAFKNDIDSYIQEVSRADAISVDKLPQYTSAEHSGKKCNLVKAVELKTDLAFLYDGVEIVDTPGLDDPVMQREEITKSYISCCDMLFHLMNVSQSATQKDIEFIIDALLYQNISKLLIVISRADTVSKEALEEVIAYTKEAIKRELEVQNKNAKLSYILETIEFVAISGKMALLCRTDSQKAKTLGYSLEESGIEQLESYLRENLFGNNSEKSQMIIHSSQRKILDILDLQRERLQYALENASKSKEELEVQLEDLSVYKQKKKKMLSALKEDLDYDENNLKSYVGSLEHFVSNEFHSLRNVVRERVVSDVRYAYEKTKKIPEPSRIKIIIETAVKDGIIDIVRDYKYKLTQKFELLNEQTAKKYKSFDLPALSDFDVETFFSDRFQTGFLTHNNELLIQSMTAAVKHSKAKETEVMDEKIKVMVKAHFMSIEADSTEKLKLHTFDLITEFMHTLTLPLDALEEKMFSHQSSLEKYLYAYTEEGGEHLSSAVVVHQKIKALNLIEEEIKGSIHAAP